jgi:GNAT superfamily N-acetyltransferase
MAPVVLTSAERPDRSDLDDLHEIWPEYNRHGDVLNRYWARLYDDFAEFQFVLYDEDEDVVLAEGHTIPFAWDGSEEGLPDGIDGVVAGGFRLREEGGAPTALSALAIEVGPVVQGRGVSRTMIEAMLRIAREHGLASLAAPLRPSWKERYPLTPIERYAAWTREDGLPFDPWLRTHVRLGGELLRTEPRSLLITGSVAEWEGWVGMPFPESGEYVFPHGLAPLRVDREADLGTYYEPNVWARHRVD